HLIHGTSVRQIAGALEGRGGKPPISSVTCRMSGSSPAGGEGQQRGSLGTLRASIEARASEQQPEGTLRVPIREAGLISLRAFGQTALGLRRAGLPPITL